MSRGTGKKKQQAEVSRGIRGCIRDRIIEEMIDAVSGKFKVLLCDEQATNLLNLCVRMHELMDHGITLVEDVMMSRQPIPTSPAIYFIAPTEASVSKVVTDWNGREMYREAHVFFTSSATSRVINMLASSPGVRSVKTLKDMLIDFAVPEPLCFNFGVRDELTRLYGGLVSQPGVMGKEGFMQEAARRLSFVFHALGAAPAVRFQSASSVSTSFAAVFQGAMDALVKEIPSLAGGDDGPRSVSGVAQSTKPKPLLIVVDRGFDCVAPLLHERTYQCMINDLMPMKDNIYEQKYKDRTGKDAVRQCPLDEQDMYWCKYRHRFFSVCLTEFPAMLKELLDSNPALSKGMEKGTKLTDLGNAVRALPEFQEKQTKLSLHIDICERLMEIYQKKKLVEVCEVEQDIAASRRTFKEILELVKGLSKNIAIPQDVKLRLLLILAAAANSKDFTEIRKQQLIQDAGLSSDAEKFANLELMNSRMGQLHQGAPRDGAGAGKAGQQQQQQAQQQSDPFRSQAKLILEAAATDALSTTDFPYLSGGGADAMGGARPTGAAADGGKRTLRAGGVSRFARNAQDRASVTAGGTLDLGFEGTVPLMSGQRIVLFVLGGMTYSEARAAYEVSQATGREVLVGGTSMMTPDNFISQLGRMR